MNLDMPFTRYLELVASIYQHEADWRIGQAYFNVLNLYRQDLSDLVRGSANDPFHTDAKIPQFLEFVATHW